MHKLGVFQPNKGTTTRRLPDVLFIVVGLADDTAHVRSQALRAAVFDGTRIGKRKIHEDFFCSCENLWTCEIILITTDNGM